MFRSIRDKVTDKFIQDNEICYVLGFMIGIGGSAETTIIGMGLYSLGVFLETRKHQDLYSWTKDVGVITVSALLLVYWSYVDPNSLITSVQPPFCPINSNEALSSTEVLKITCLTIFGISCNHSALEKIRKLICGVAIGLSIYVIPTIIGSIALQGIRGGGDKIFNIFSGDLTAQSTTAGYIVIMIIGMLSSMKKRKLLILAIALAFITGIQTSNRSVILFGMLGSITEFVSWLRKRKLAGNLQLHLFKNKKGSYLFLIFMMTALSLALSTQFIYSRISAALDGRLRLYVEGYSHLIDYLLKPTNNLLQDTGSILWWHSVPLDATRAGNLSGAYLSLAWLAILIIGLMMTIKKGNLGLLLLNLGLLFIYMTGMPLATGAYEFIALYCGYLLVSNELIPNHRG